MFEANGNPPVAFVYHLIDVPTTCKSLRVDPLATNWFVEPVGVGVVFTNGALISIVNEHVAEPYWLVAVKVNRVLGINEVGVPEICPVVGFKDRPVGKAGLIK